MDNIGIKINVWKIGYTTFKDYLLGNKENTKYIDQGYVMIENTDDLWEEDVWHLLNWSCWNYDDSGNAIKPESVHSPLDHCNSDIIINIDGTNIYKYAKDVGFGDATSLDDAFNKAIDDFCNFWPLSGVKRTSGEVKHTPDNKVLQKINGEWIEITW